MTTPTTEQPVDPYRTHKAARRVVEGHVTDDAEAREILEMLGIVDDAGELRPDDTTSNTVPTVGHSPGKDTAPSQRRTNFDQADDPRGLSTSPPGLRDYAATEPQKVLARAPRAAAPKKPPVKRSPRKKAPAPVRSFDTAPIPPLELTVRHDDALAFVPDGVRADFPATEAPVARPSTTSTPSARPAAGNRRTGPRVKPIEHGTPKGYSAHYRKKELPVCDPCKDAWNAMTRAKKRDKRKHQAIVKARRGAADIATELDAWFAEAQHSPHASVSRAAAVATGALMALRIAVDDLARTEHAVDGVRDDERVSA